jgi:hypothetical protein
MSPEAGKCKMNFNQQVEAVCLQHLSSVFCESTGQAAALQLNLPRGERGGAIRGSGTRSVGDGIVIYVRPAF